MNQCNEEWVSVEGFGKYSISNLGRVRRDAPGPGTQAGRILKPVIDNGYPSVTFWDSGKPKRFRVHVLVAQHFIGPRPDKAHVNHVDGVKTNNCVSNLEYISARENTLHQHRIGLVNVRGEGNGHAKLNDVAVREIRKLYGTVKGVELARRYGVSPTTISEVVHGKVWKHLTK